MNGVVDALAPIRAEADAVRGALASDGAALLRGLLPAADVTEVAEEVRRALVGVGWLADDGTFRPIGESHLQPNPDFWPGYKAVWSLESLHRLAVHPRLTGLLGDVFGEQLFCHIPKVVRLAYPEGPGVIPTTPHQDMSLVSATTDVLTCWIPLVDVPRTRGPLKILRGSQDGGLRPIVGPNAFVNIRVAADDDDPAWASADFEIGDVLVFHNLTVHAALPNTTDQLRVSFDSRYQSAVEPVRPFSVDGHHVTNIGSLAENTAHWQSTEWVSVPDDIPIEPSPLPGRPLKEHVPHISVGPSRFVSIPRQRAEISV